MDKKNYEKEKLPRAIVLANTKKTADIKKLLGLRDEMTSNNIDPVLIKNFIDEEYDKINKTYENKIRKCNEKQKNNLETKITKEVKQKKKKAIEFLIKNKNFLEEHGASKEYIIKYVEKQYTEINEYYNETNFTKPDFDLDNNLADFID